MDSPRQSIRRWIEGRRAAERRERDAQTEDTPPPGESIARALRLIAFAASIHGWPLPRDPASAREDTEAYERWVRLRTRLSQA